MATALTIKFPRKTRNAVCDAGNGLPSVGLWLDRIRCIGDPMLVEAIEGIWCGREGRVSIDLPGSRTMLCMGWYNGKVEWSYLS